MPTNASWFLRKHADGRLFGPISFDQLSRWASAAQVAPHDSISIDQLTWMKAPMLPELGMDWIAEVTSERLYGPTTLGAIREFVRLGEIDDETFVINACNGSRQQIRSLASLFAVEETAIETSETASEAPTLTAISIRLEDRIRELEQALREERRALAEAETRYCELEERHNQLVNAAAASGPVSVE